MNDLPRPVFGNQLARFRTHFREAVQKDGVICLECGRQFKSLAQHLGKHQLSSDDYKAKWGYNRTTPLERLSTRRKKRRNAIAMKFWTLSPPNAHRKATKARRGHGMPYRPERRLLTTEAARARVIAGFRLPELRGKDKIAKTDLQAKGQLHVRVSSRFNLSKEDRKILTLGKRGLWPSQIASRLGTKVSAVLWRFERLRQKGFTIPRPTSPRPNAHRKVTDEELLAVARSGLSIPEIAAKLGIATQNAHRRIKRLMKRS